jgi:hypothetical protein
MRCPDDGPSQPAAVFAPRDCYWTLHTYAVHIPFGLESWISFKAGEQEIVGTGVPRVEGDVWMYSPRVRNTYPIHVKTPIRRRWLKPQAARAESRQDLHAGGRRRVRLLLVRRQRDRGEVRYLQGMRRKCMSVHGRACVRMEHVRGCVWCMGLVRGLG